MGRLKPGLSAAQGEARLTGLQNWLITREGSAISDERRRRIAISHVELTPGGSGIPRMRRSYSQTLRLLLGISTAVLLIVRANIANLLLARGAGRRAETLIRLALGASRGRLVRQSLTESLTLVLIGGALGLLVAWAGTKLLVALVFRGTNYVPIEAAPDFIVLAFAFVLSCAAAVVFGLLPAMRTTSEAAPSIGGTSRGILGSVSRRKFGLSNLLIVGEVALARGGRRRLVGAQPGEPHGPAVRFRSRERSRRQRRSWACAIRVQPPGAVVSADGRALELALRRESAALSYYSPFNGCCWAYTVSVQGYRPQPQESTTARLNRVSSRYFETLGTRVLLGRAFNEHDTPRSSRVAVVNETFADRYLHGENPIGRRFGIDRDDGTSADLEIVGVVENAKYDSPREDPTPMAFLPLLQVKPGDAASAARDGSNFINAIEVRATGDPTAVVGQIRQALAEIDPGLPVLRVDTLSDHIGRELNQENVIAVLTMCFGLLALVLACVGLYGLMAYVVQRRTGEIGVRMALGASRGMVIGMVLREALVQGAVGILIGIPAAFAATRLVASQLYGRQPDRSEKLCRGCSRPHCVHHHRGLPTGAPRCQGRSHDRASLRLTLPSSCPTSPSRPTFSNGAGAPRRRPANAAAAFAGTRPPARAFADASPRIRLSSARHATPARLPRWGPRHGRRPPPRHSIIALSSATRSMPLNLGISTSTSPPGPSLTGSAAVRVRTPARSSGATKQVTDLRECPETESTTLQAADASAYGPTGQSAPIRRVNCRRIGSVIMPVNADPATAASSQAITI